MNDKGQTNRWLGLLFICISLLNISLDNTILNVAFNWKMCCFFGMVYSGCEE